MGNICSFLKGRLRGGVSTFACCSEVLQIRQDIDFQQGWSWSALTGLGKLAVRKCCDNKRNRFFEEPTLLVDICRNSIFRFSTQLSRSWHRFWLSNQPPCVCVVVLRSWGLAPFSDWREATSKNQPQHKRVFRNHPPEITLLLTRKESGHEQQAATFSGNGSFSLDQPASKQSLCSVVTLAEQARCSRIWSPWARGRWFATCFSCWRDPARWRSELSEEMIYFRW